MHGDHINTCDNFCRKRKIGVASIIERISTVGTTGAFAFVGTQCVPANASAWILLTTFTLIDICIVYNLVN